MKKMFKLADGRNVSIEVGEVMTNMVVVTIDDELVPSSLFVDTFESTEIDDGIISQNVFFHPVDELDEVLFDEFNLDFDDISRITSEIVKMGDITISVIAELAA